MNRLTALVSTLVDNVATGGDLTATETETLTYPAPPAVAVETTNGEVSVRGEDRDDVSVTATKRATDDATLDTVSVVADGGGDQPLTIQTEYDDSRGRAAVDLHVAVPRDVPVASVRTKNGSVTVERATGDAELVTKNGSVELLGHDGDADVTAKNGRVEATDVAGDLAVAAKNGSVTVDGLDGYLDARTEHGSVEGRGVAGVDRAESKNGSVDLDVDAVRGDATVATKSGSITLRVGPDLDADVALSTGVGSVDAPAIGESAGGLDGTEVRGTLGDGGPLLSVESNVGSVELARRADAAAP